MTLDVLTTLFKDYFVPSKNITFEGYIYFPADKKLEVGFDQYLAELHTLSKICEFV